MVQARVQTSLVKCSRHAHVLAWVHVAGKYQELQQESEAVLVTVAKYAFVMAIGAFLAKKFL